MSCKEISKLATRALGSKLTWSEFLSMRMHLLMCRMCHGYSKELKKLVEMARNRQLDIHAELSDEQKERILNEIRRCIADDDHSAQ